ncbi:MAG: hypothetical protein ACRDKB_13660 [Actinomycetota bacterium]
MTALLGLAVLVACRPDGVVLTYDFGAGDTRTFLMRARAEAAWDLGDPGRGSYSVEFEITETIASTSGDRATASIEMVPVAFEEDGLPSPGAAPRTFELELGSKGEVIEILEVDGIPASMLDPDQLVFLGTYRPPLPTDRAGIADTWESEQQLELAGSFQQLVTAGTLTSLDRDRHGAIARLAYTGRGPLIRSLDLPQGEARLTGSAESITRAVFDISRGALRRAASTTTGSFDVRIVPGGGDAPVSGSLELTLSLTIESTG